MPAVVVHVLVVDDEPATLVAMQTFLGRKGLRVTTASNGREALAAFGADPADVVVTDMRMPHMGGAELVSALRAIDPGLPVLVATGWSGELDGLRASGPLLEVMHKPVEPRELLDCVLRLAGR